MRLPEVPLGPVQPLPGLWLVLAIDSAGSGHVHWLMRVLDLREHPRLAVAVAAVSPLVVCAVLSLFRGSLTSATEVLVLVLLVVALAATGERLAGLVAALSSGVWFDFFLTEPHGRFTIAKADDIEITVLLVLIGIAVTEVALWGRRQQARASRRAGYLDGVLGTAEIVAGRHEDPQQLIDRVSRELEDLLGVERCRFTPGPVRDPRFAILGHDGAVTRDGRKLRVDRNGLPTDEETAVPVLREGNPVGHFVLTSATRAAFPSLEQRRVAVLLADQVAPVLGGGQ